MSTRVGVLQHFLSLDRGEMVKNRVEGRGSDEETKGSPSIDRLGDNKRHERLKKKCSKEVGMMLW